MTQEKLWTKNFVLIIIINYLVFVNHSMVLSTFPVYVEKLGGTEAVAGLAATAFSHVAVVCRPFVGWLLDNGKRKAILFVGLVGLALMPAGYLCALSLALALFFRMLHGASLACSNTTSSTIATDVIPKTRFAEGMGMFGMATALATAVAPALGLALMGKGFPTLFLTASGIAVLGLVLFLFVKAPTPAVEKKPLSFKALYCKSALPASTIMLVFLLTFGALENFLAKFASENELPSGGLFFAIMAAMLAAFLLLALVPNTVTFCLAAALAGYGFGGLEPALQSMAVHIAAPEERGAANSTFLCAYDIGIGLGGGLAGELITALGYRPMFAILTLATVASVLLYVLWGRKDPSSFRYGK